MVCKADTRMYIDSGMNGHTSSDFCGCSCCYKLSREGADPRSLLRGGACVWMLWFSIVVNSIRFHPP
jgi:hypothetical protein